MRDYRIKRIIVDKRVKDSYFVSEVIKRAGGVEIEEVSTEKDSFFADFSFEEGKSTLFLTSFPGSFVKTCPGTGRGYLCCGYYVINQPVGCPLDCSYCILQDYLGPSPLVLYVNFERIKEQLDDFLKEQGENIIRIGNGELTDSLALDWLGDFSSFFISYFRNKKNVIFEFKTKTDQVEKALELPSCSNIVFSWSLNPQSIISREEHFCARLEKRIEAAFKVQKKGFMLAFHFDPLIFYPGWEKDYERLIDTLFTFIDPSRIFWISMGALRFPPSLKDIIKERFPESKIIYEEMIKGLDGKIRYIKPLRIKLFKKVYSLIREKAPRVFCYLCMESPDVWEKVMGFSPSSNHHFKKIFEKHCREVLEKGGA